MRRIGMAAISTMLAATAASASIHGLVMTRDGKSVANASVAAYAIETADQRSSRLVSATPERPVIASAKTSSKGEFDIDPKKLPVVELEITAPSLGTQKKIAVDGDDAGVFMLRAASVRTAQVRADGKPVAGAIVSFTSGYETKTDANGSFTIPENAAPARMVVVAEGYAVVSRIVPDAKRGNLDVALPAGVAIEGTAVMENGKSPVPKAVVDIDGFPLGTTDSEGHFAVAHADPLWREIRVHKEDRLGTLTRPPVAAPLRVVTRPASVVAAPWRARSPTSAERQSRPRASTIRLLRQDPTSNRASLSRGADRTGTTSSARLIRDTTMP